MGPASASPKLQLQAGWLLLSKGWGVGEMGARKERMKAGKTPFMFALVCYFNRCAFLAAEKKKGGKGSRWNKKESN